jgi:hypothetical protein
MIGARPHGGQDLRIEQVVEPEPAPGEAVELAAGWREFLVQADDAYLRAIPEPGVNSPIQYGAHVRDILRVYGERMVLAVEEDSPTVPIFNPPRRSGRSTTAMTPKSLLRISKLEPAVWQRSSKVWSHRLGPASSSTTVDSGESTASRSPAWRATPCTRPIIICSTPRDPIFEGVFLITRIVLSRQAPPRLFFIPCTVPPIRDPARRTGRYIVGRETVPTVELR